MFKKLKKYLIIGVGASALALGISGQFKTWREGYANNIDFVFSDFSSVVFVGDTGLQSKERKMLENEIKGGNYRHVFLLGDLVYPSGPNNLDDFKTHVMPFLGNHQTYCIGGNHSAYGFRSDWLFENSDKNGCKYGNYFRGIIYNDACVLIIESTVYDQKIGSKKLLHAQEDFSREFLADYRCENKDKFLLMHHTVYTFGPHANDGSERLREFVESLPVKYVISGHDHILAKTEKHGKTYFASGAGSKLSKCENAKKDDFCLEKIGFLEYRNKQFKFITIKE